MTVEGAPPIGEGLASVENCDSGRKVVGVGIEFSGDQDAL
jgi:hypothetical protein